MHTYNKLYKFAHVGTIFIVLFVVCGFLFQHSVFAKVYVSKETMKSCFDKYGSDENVLKNCFLAFSTTKNEEKTQKYAYNNEKNTKEYKCNPGEYLPANATKCTTCKNRYYVCTGGSFALSSEVQGIVKCPSGQIANANKTKCEQNRNSDNVSESKREKECEPGKYLVGPVLCMSCPDGYICPGGKQGKIKCDDGKIPNFDNTKCIFNNSQQIYNEDVSDDRNVDISKMSEQEACEYWTKVAGYWNKDNNTCVPSGGSLWMAKWNRDAKMFECLNIFDAAEKWRDAQWREEQKSWLESYRKHIYDDKGNLKPAVIGLQWDRNFGKCTSEIERQCIASGDTYDWFGTCYRHENNKKTCIDIIGGKWKDENGQESCECNIGQYDMLSWTPQKCQYKILLKQENSSTNYIDQQNTGPHTYSDTIPLEYCFEKYKDGFLNNQLSEPKSKLNCK